MNWLFITRHKGACQALDFSARHNNVLAALGEEMPDRDSEGRPFYLLPFRITSEPMYKDRTQLGVYLP